MDSGWPDRPAKRPRSGQLPANDLDQNATHLSDLPRGHSSPPQGEYHGASDGPGLLYRSEYALYPPLIESTNNLSTANSDDRASWKNNWAEDETSVASSESSSSSVQERSLEMEDCSSSSDSGGDSEESVCFGMLCDIPAKFYRSRGHNVAHEIREVLDCDDDPVPLSLACAESYCMINTELGQSIGVLNKKASDAFTELLALGPLTLHGSSKHSILQAGLVELEKGAPSPCFEMNITILGPAEISENVARVLSTHRLYLQHPDVISDFCRYANPQYLDMPDWLEDEACDGHAKDLAGDMDARDSKNPSRHPRDLLALFDALSGIKDLRPATADPCITTQLKEYQQHALDFILGREFGDDTKYVSLWEATRPHNGGLVYRHAITGSKRPTPEDIRGGILADEMGLGKTLTMISAITTTLRKAKELTKPLQEAGDPGALFKSYSTLVIVPSALLIDGWVNEIERHTQPGSITYSKHHGPQRRLDINEPLPDVVLSTYGTVCAELGRSHGSIRQIHWYRIVLDEAHVVRNWSTKQFQAMSSISSHIRWCMTGTPVQNSLDDLGALVRFLRVPMIGEVSSFRKYVSGKNKNKNKNKLANLQINDYTNLKRLIRAICLRRNTDVLNLPGVEFCTRHLVFSEDERNEYNALDFAYRQAVHRAALGSGSKGQNSGSILGAVLNMRLFCNQGLNLGQYPGGFPTDSDEILSLMQQKGASCCAYCGCDLTMVTGSEPAEKARLTACHMLVCGDMDCAQRFRDALRAGGDHGFPVCPFCKNKHRDDNLLDLADENNANSAEKLVQSAYSSKLKVLLENVQNKPTEEKSIIFSFWKRTLDTVGKMLTENGISYCQVNGSLSKSQRVAALEEFRSSPRTTLLLITLGTGSTGLNDLNVANSVHILEPQWNPSIERQAIGRISRLGQEKAVTVFRYIVDESIEEEIEDRQGTKLQLAMGGGLYDEGSNDKVKRRVHRQQQIAALKRVEPVKK
ncbi:SNF2 family N-terminal domain-containing protein [Lasiosphaeria miniovina]|uniref:SNF2 family N-terminal domain-containing protein n=1 Tax=Lasiosphaeria miniovina TaxID=1954250 RepID=A0AA40BET8_9PEZI|nr:SNF2 family N-terminal domain-containing protein [Lasiosphaeria miniovina]KAK0732943.1 SNF2 family N-terminal domain-containing protein [Lasiosphaeria miniovina]